jgi:large subunit ribosomal protein L3
MTGHFRKAGVTPHRHLVEVRVDDPESFTLGQEISVADVLAKGGRADVAGVTKGKGFTGVMRRHNFAGQGASHGAHRIHRAPGSIGACATPSRVFKGMAMAGRMGGERRTAMNLEIVEVDPERNLLLLKGAVPGSTGSVVLVREAVKHGG